MHLRCKWHRSWENIYRSNFVYLALTSKTTREVVKSQFLVERIWKAAFQSPVAPFFQFSLWFATFPAKKCAHISNVATFHCWKTGNSAHQRAKKGKTKPGVLAPKAKVLGGGISLGVDVGPSLVDGLHWGGIHGVGVKQRSRQAWTTVCSNTTCSQKQTPDNNFFCAPAETSREFRRPEKLKENFSVTLGQQKVNSILILLKSNRIHWV